MTEQDLIIQGLRRENEGLKAELERKQKEIEFAQRRQMRSSAHLKALTSSRTGSGKWIQKKEWRFGRWVAWFECSECGTHDDNADMYNAMPFCNLTNYCPECGAKMDEVSE